MIVLFVAAAVVFAAGMFTGALIVWVQSQAAELTCARCAVLVATFERKVKPTPAHAERDAFNTLVLIRKELTKEGWLDA